MSEPAAAQYGARDLAVPIVDTNGRDLRLFLGTTDHEPVATRALVVGDCVVHLDVLAASHRVRVVTESGRQLVETVACDVGNGIAERLPASAEWVVADRVVSFSSALVEGLSVVEAAAAAIDCLDPDRSLVVRFPGDALALTAIALVANDDPNLIAWRTWHLYPGLDPHVVTTDTSAHPAPNWPVTDPNEPPSSTARLRSTELQGVS